MKSNKFRWIRALIILITIYFVYSLYNYKHYGEILNKESTTRNKILTGYAYLSALEQANYRISKKHLGGRNTDYLTNDEIYNLAKNKVKTKKTAVNLFRQQNGSGEIKMCIEKMKLHHALLSYNCVEVRLRGETLNIVCELQETQAVPNGKYSECDMANSISAWYRYLDLP